MVKKASARVLGMIGRAHMTFKEMVDYAFKNVSRNQDDAAWRRDVIKVVQSMLDPPDINAILEKEATELVDKATKSGMLPSRGQLKLDCGSAPYEPDMLIVTGVNSELIVEQKNARPQAKIDQRDRQLDNLLKVEARFARTDEEVKRFSKWHKAQIDLGRNPTELTFDNFVIETGIWREDDD